MVGVIVNAIAAFVGGSLGLIFRNHISKKISDAAIKCVALCVLYIGISGSISSGNNLSSCLVNDRGQGAILLVLSMVLGTVIGTALDLDAKLDKLGQAVSKLLPKHEDGHSVANGFVSASLLFCVGAMTLMGCINSGLYGDHQLLYIKSVIDFIAAIALASSLGVGVVLSGFFVLGYQGLLVILSTLIAPYLSDLMIYSMSLVGNVLIIGLGLNVLGVTKLKLTNMTPAVFLPILFCLIIQLVPVFQ